MRCKVVPHGKRVPLNYAYLSFGSWPKSVIAVEGLSIQWVPVGGGSARSAAIRHSFIHPSGAWLGRLAKVPDLMPPSTLGGGITARDCSPNEWALPISTCFSNELYRVWPTSSGRKNVRASAIPG